jgi:outer membrane protein assembly factor BamA
MRARPLVLTSVALFLTATPLAAQERDSLVAPPPAPRLRIFPVPVLGYTPETSLMFGVAVVGVRPGASASAGERPTRPSTALFTAVYTLKKQFQLGLDLDHWTAGNRWHLTTSTGVDRFPVQFHGIGAASTDSSETYTPQHLTLAVAAQRLVASHLYVGAGYALRHTRVVDVEALGRLAPGTVVGSRGGTEAALTVDGVWDSRDLLYMTRRGGYLRLSLGLAGRALGGEHAWRRYTGDLRGYQAVGRVVLAAQAVVDATDGTVPFEQLPHLGGQNILRGYTAPRFVDGTMSAAQAEARVPVLSVVSVVVFGGLGATAPSLRAIPDAPLRVAGGLGARLLLDRANGLQLRVDYAFAKGGGGLYVAAGDAF